MNEALPSSVTMPTSSLSLMSRTVRTEFSDPLVGEDQPHQQGHYIWPEASEVYDDEPCLLLVERVETLPNYRGRHRYQTLFVWRNNGIAKYMEDMGPADLNLAPPLQIPGGDPALPGDQWLETVDSLRDHANHFREFLVGRTLEREVPDLIKGYYDQSEQEQLAARHQSVSGRYHKVER